MRWVSFLLLALLVGGIGILTWTYGSRDVLGPDGLTAQEPGSDVVLEEAELVPTELPAERDLDPGNPVPGSIPPPDYLSGESAQAPVEAFAETRIEFLVVDTAGKPQAHYPLRTGVPNSNDNGSLVTAAGMGRAWFHPWGAGLGWGYKDNSAAENWNGKVWSNVPWHDDVRMKVSRDEPMPIRLVVPETGSMTVHLQGPDKKPYGGETRVSVHAAKKSVEKHVWTTSKVLFHHLPLDLEFEVVVQSVDGAPTVRAKVEALSSTQRTRNVTLTITDPRFPLLGRLIGPNGKPMKDQLAYFRLEGAGSQQFRTTSKGRFRAVLPAGFTSRAFIEAAIYGPQPDHRAELPARGLIMGVDNELGDLTLAPMDTMGMGRLYFPTKKPLGNTTLRAEVQTDGGQWEWLATLRTDTDGSFQFPLDLWGRPVRLLQPQSALLGSSAFMIPGSRIIPTPSKPLALVAYPAGRIAGRLTLPSGADHVLELTYRSGEVVAVPIREEGQFFSESVWPGEVDARVWRTDTRALVQEVEGLTIDAGKQTDPRWRTGW